MSERPSEERLQEFLDGRLTPEERAAFEELLRDDPDLAAAARTARSIGETLGEQESELSPGFYARARNAFEESTTGAGGGIRLLSWETAGLAAAAVLVLALFVPQFLREGPPVPGVSPPAQMAQERAPAHGPAVDDAKDRDAVALDEIAAGRLGAADAIDKEARVEEELRELDGRKGASADPWDALPAPEKSEELRRSEKKQSSNLPRAEPAASDEGFAPAPPAVDPETSAGDSAVERQDAASAPATVRSGAMMKKAAEPLRELADFESSAAPKRKAAIAAVALPPDVVEPGTVRTLEQRETWNALLRSEAGRDLAGLGAPDPAMRLVLIGGRDDLGDCAELSVRETGDAWEIRYPAVDRTGAKAEASSGCALTLPRDGRPVRVVASR